MDYPCSLDWFEEVVSGDTEFHNKDDGNPSQTICYVLHEWRANRATRVWTWGCKAPPCPPVLQSPKTLFVAYTGHAELTTFHAMGWDLTRLTPWLLDLNVEMRNLTNGLTAKPFIGLYDSAKRYDIPYLNKDHKEAMRDICKRGNSEEIEQYREAILRYCDDDVAVLKRLALRILPRLSLPHALFRGQYVAATAAMDVRGLPINKPAYQLILDWRKALREAVARTANEELGELFDQDMLRKDRLAVFVRDQGLEKVWPKTPHTGTYCTDGDTLRLMQLDNLKVQYFHEVLNTLRDLNAVSFAIGNDGRNRFFPGLWGTITGRNAPKAKHSIFHRARWWRNLVAAMPYWAWAYLDFSAEEFFVAAVLANDAQALQDYLTGDVYTTWGRSLGLIPEGPEPKVKGKVRDKLKVAVLALIYGIQPHALALILGITPALAHKISYSFATRYAGIEAYVTKAAQRGGTLGLLHTRLDWRLHIKDVVANKSSFGGRSKPANVMTINTLRDWLSQSNASDILHTAVVLVAERGVRIVGTLHDAIMIEAPLEDIDHAVQLTTQAMQEASRLLLFGPNGHPGYTLKVDATVVRYPGHYIEEKSQPYWQHIRAMLRQLSGVDIENMEGRRGTEVEVIPSSPIVTSSLETNARLVGV
jgi:DNA polymerase I